MFTSAVRSRAVRNGALLIAGAAGAVLLTGCGAGQNTQTANMAPAVPGVEADVDGIALRNVQIAYGGRQERVYPVGSNAPLEAAIFNTGLETATLVKVESEAAESVRLVDTGASPVGACPAASASPGVGSAPSAAPSPTGAPASPTGSPTGSPASPTGSPAAPGSPSPTGPTAGGATEFSVTLAPGSCALLDSQNPQQLVLTGLKQQIMPGEAAPVVFTFEKAGRTVQATLEVPVGVPSEAPKHSPVNIHPVEPSIVGAPAGGEGGH